MTIQSKNKSLKKNTAWMILGNTYYALCQWLVLMILARVGGAEDVGIFTLALAITGPIIIFFELGIRTIIATDVDSENDYTAYFMVRSIASFAGITLCFIFALFYENYIFWTVIVVALFKVSESFSQMYYGYAIRQEKLNRISISLISRGTLSTIILTISYILTKNIPISASAYMISWVAVLIFYDRYNISERLHIINQRTLESSYRILLSGLPLGITSLLGVLGIYIPRYFLESTHGLAELGIYSSMAYFITIGNIAVYAFGQSMIPILSKYNANNEYKKFNKMVFQAFLLVLIMGAVGVSLAYLIGDIVLEIMYGSEFSAHSDILPIIAISASITYLANIFGYAINSKRIFMAQVPAQLLVIVVSCLGSWFYIPTYGIDGAAYVLVLSSVTMFFSLLVVLFIHTDKR